MNFPLLTSLALLVSVLPVVGQELDEAWMMNYYENPRPEKLVEQVRASAAQGLLKQDKSAGLFVGFLSEVMAQNPKKIAGWLKELESLDETQRSPLVSAAWYSGTDEGRAFLKEQGMNLSPDQKAKILDLELDQPAVLDMLWGCFFASGDIAAIRRIIRTLSLCEHLGAVERFKTSAKTPEDNQKAVLELTFNAAMWSLQANCTQHPRALEYCEKIYAEGTLPQDQGLWLGVMLSKVKPEKYHVEIKDGKAKVTRK
jgi:hypothetical protein